MSNLSARERATPVTGAMLESAYLFAITTAIRTHHVAVQALLRTQQHKLLSCSMNNTSRSSSGDGILSYS
jgi:hypothetical protein